MQNKIITINRNKDFNRTYSRGRSYVSSSLVTYILKSKHTENLLGITASKKIGNAVKRNRARRIIKESYRTLAPVLEKGNMIVFVARKKTTIIKSTQLLIEMRIHMRKLGLL